MCRDESELRNYNGDAETARHFRQRAFVVLTNLKVALEHGQIACGVAEMEFLTPEEYLSRCMWAASESRPRKE